MSQDSTTLNCTCGHREAHRAEGTVGRFLAVESVTELALKVGSCRDTLLATAVRPCGLPSRMCMLDVCHASGVRAPAAPSNSNLSQLAVRISVSARPRGSGSNATPPKTRRVSSRDRLALHAVTRHDASDTTLPSRADSNAASITVSDATASDASTGGCAPVRMAAATPA